MGKTIWWSTGSGRIELEMTLGQAESVSHSGRCDEDVKYLMSIPAIKKQLDAIPNSLMATELAECGVWDDEQLQDNTDNRMRLVWIAGCDISEEHNSD